MADVLVSRSPPAARTRLSDRLVQNVDSVDARYASERHRQYRAIPTSSAF